ncbi:MAG: E3 binding domain-containing protein, partial [Burkholderiales bacterium]|nr:E3 binding domain-containing protein [Burkholderiales bacterium]
MADFLMPALGADMETGRLVQWLVKPGDRVRRGDIVAVVETHKGAIDVEIFLDGVIRDLAPLGQDMKVGALLARVGPADEAASPAVSALPSDAVMPVSQPAPAAAIAVKTCAVSPQGAADATPVAVPVPGRRPLASPAARQRARELGLSREQLAAIAGSGVGGAVCLADVESVESGLHARVAVPIPLPLVQPVPGSA